MDVQVDLDQVLFGAAALISALGFLRHGRRVSKDLAAVNAAVNNVPEGTPSISDRVSAAVVASSAAAASSERTHQAIGRVEGALRAHISLPGEKAHG